jgi:hypothetical protein
MSTPYEYEYRFAGKLAMFPLAVAFFILGGIGLLRYGRETYTGAYFRTNEFYFGIAGVALFFVAVAAAVLFLWFTVIKIRVSVPPHSETWSITKIGVFRRRTLCFSRQCTLCYHRSHYMDARAWLTLVVLDDGKYYQLLSWRGTGNQRALFFEVLEKISELLLDVQREAAPQHERVRKKPVLEIISAAEASLLTPFADRPSVHGLLVQHRVLEKLEPRSRERRKTRLLVLERLPQVVNLNSFFGHFSRTDVDASVS